MNIPPEQPERKPLLYGPDNQPLPLDEGLTIKEKEKPKEKTPRQWELRTLRKISLRQFLIGVLTGSIAVIGLIASLLALLPRVSMTISDPVNPSDPLSSSVTITNTGYIPLRAVSPKFQIGTIQASRNPDSPLPPEPEHLRSGNNLSRTFWGPYYLAPEAHISFAFNQLINIKEANFVYADLGLVVDYETPILPIHRRKVLRMTTRRQSNGQLYWYLRPEL